MARCKGCEHKVLWAVDRTDSAVMLEAHPSDRGTHAYVNGKTWPATDVDRKLLRPLHRTHTCGRSS